MLHHVLAIPAVEWLLQSAAGSQIGRMLIRLAKRAGIRPINVVRRREVAAELKQLGADAVIVSTDGPIDEQVRHITVRTQSDTRLTPVAGDTGTQMFKAPNEDGRMLVYGSLTGERSALATIHATSWPVGVFWKFSGSVTGCPGSQHKRAAS